MADLLRAIFLFTVLVAIVVFASTTVTSSFKNLSWVRDTQATDRTPAKSSKVKKVQRVDKSKKGFDRSLDLLGDVADDTPLWQ